MTSQSYHDHLPFPSLKGSFCRLTISGPRLAGCSMEHQGVDSLAACFRIAQTAENNGTDTFAPHVTFGLYSVKRVGQASITEY